MQNTVRFVLLYYSNTSLATPVRYSVTGVYSEVTYVSVLVKSLTNNWIRDATSRHTHHRLRVSNPLQLCISRYVLLLMRAYETYVSQLFGHPLPRRTSHQEDRAYSTAVY